MSFNFKNILTYLDTAKEIEQILVRTYRGVKFPFKKPGVYERNISLFNKELYDLIIELKRLPSVKEYEESYLGKYLTRPANKVALQYHANNAYKGLVSELHFYFTLKESGLFDDVRMDYTYDLEAKTDILLYKNGKSLGLQLFSGDKNYQLSKEKSIRNLQLGYKLMLYNLRDFPERKKEITCDDGSKIVLYGTKDVNFLSDYLSISGRSTPEELMKAALTDRFELVPEGIKQVGNTPDSGEVQYSYIYIGVQTNQIEEYLRTLRTNGKKVFALYNKAQGDTFTAIDGHIFSLNGKPLSKIEGFQYLEDEGTALRNFSFHQYKIEHAEPSYNIAVNAGAGSGKTTTLVSRILYLLFTKQINSLQEIVMITFTNEAATNMKEALEERLENLYRTTGKEIHYQYLQQVSLMKIVTIPTFAKDILSQFSHYIGLAANIQITEMTVKRREILEEYLDKWLAKDENNPFNNLEYFKIIRFLEDIWDKFNQKGIVEQELTDFLQSNPYDDPLKITVVNILKDAEKKFTSLKFDEDFLTVSDLTRFLKLLIDKQVPLHELNKNYKYLLVDEFQDTDIAQIQFIATIAAKAKLRLTVVGDTKQSVYRFRGADSTAFTVLDEYLEQLNYQTLHTYHLVENFRSSRLLIEDVEKIFGRWRKKELLPSDEQPMFSRQENYMHLDNIFALYNEEFTIDYLLEDFTLMPPKDEKSNVLAVLVRNNHEAISIGEELKKLSNGPQYEVRTEGTLYVSKAARDLGILLHSWLYAKSDDIAQKQALFSLSETAFCTKNDSVHFTVKSGIKIKDSSMLTTLLLAFQSPGIMRWS